jgi:hypothetical protein
MSSKLAQLLDQVGKSKGANAEKMNDLSLLDESLLSSVAGGAGGAQLPGGYESEEIGQNAVPYVKYWQDL